MLCLVLPLGTAAGATAAALIAKEIDEAEEHKDDRKKDSSGHLQDPDNDSEFLFG